MWLHDVTLSPYKQVPQSALWSIPQNFHWTWGSAIVFFSFSSLVKQAILWKKPLSYAEFSWCLPKYSYPLKRAQNDRYNLNNEYQAYCIAKQYYYETKATAIKKEFNLSVQISCFGTASVTSSRFYSKYAHS